MSKYTTTTVETRTRKTGTDWPEWSKSDGVTVDSVELAFENVDGVTVYPLPDSDWTDETVNGAMIEGPGLELQVRQRETFVGLHDGVRMYRDELRKARHESIEGSWREVALDEALELLEELISEERAAIQRTMPEGYCVHGVYVGGCGVDWMCGRCEGGDD